MSASHSASTPKSLLAVLAIIILAVLFEFFYAGGMSNIDLVKKPTTEAEYGYKVVKVIDGDTLDVEKDGEVTRVRLIGINTPESVDPRREVECMGVEASNYTKEEMLGEAVMLETDPSQDLFDSYGRKLAYVYKQSGEMINRQLIASGYAYEYTYDNPYKYQTEFKKLERFAKNENRGLWDPNNCQQ